MLKKKMCIDVDNTEPVADGWARASTLHACRIAEERCLVDCLLCLSLTPRRRKPFFLVSRME